jgi:hypothetical protein
MDISCHSFVRMAKLAEPLITDGGVLVTMSYYGANKVIANYDPGVTRLIKSVKRDGAAASPSGDVRRPQSALLSSMHCAESHLRRADRNMSAIAY